MGGFKARQDVRSVIAKRHHAGISPQVPDPEADAPVKHARETGVQPLSAGSAPATAQPGIFRDVLLVAFKEAD